MGHSIGLLDSAEGGMPSPLAPYHLLHHVEGNAPADSLHPEAVAKALGAGVGAIRDARCGDDLLHPPVGRHATPRPQQCLRLPAPLRLPDAVNQIEGVQQLGRHRHGPVNTPAALLQALEHDDAPRQVDLLRRQSQGFGDPAAGCVQHAAEGAHLARGFGRSSDEGPALLLSDVEAAALGVEELHARLGRPG